LTIVSIYGQFFELRTRFVYGKIQLVLHWGLSLLEPGLFSAVKHELASMPLSLPISDKERLVALTHNDVLNDVIVDKLFQWRLAAVEFKDLRSPTLDSTKAWLANNYLANTNKLLFMVESENMFIGHMGFNLFFSTGSYLEIDNVIRGVKGRHKGIMTRALRTMIAWGVETFAPELIYLRTTECNSHAIDFYLKCGFYRTDTTMSQLYANILDESSHSLHTELFMLCEQSDSRFILLALGDIERIASK